MSLPDETDKGANQIQPGLFDKAVLDDKDKNSVYIAVKHYASKGNRGVSHMLHNTLGSDCKFIVKGPLGLGLRFVPDATNVCFIGGTAILSIIDFIARFVLFNCGMVLEDKNNEGPLFGKKFKLILFYAVENEEKALFLPILRQL